MKGKAKLFRMLNGLVLMFPVLADAHPFHWATDSVGFWSGLFHPLTSSEHVIALMAVGMWISLSGREGLKYMPVMFMAFMLLGGSLTLFDIAWPHMELLSALSILVLGSMLALGLNAASAPALLVFSNVAVLYGYRHAYEILLDVDAIAYVGGFALGTLTLIAVGAAIMRVVSRIKLKYMAGRFEH